LIGVKAAIEDTFLKTHDLDFDILSALQAFWKDSRAD
jgi:hypothetical protein